MKKLSRFMIGALALSAFAPAALLAQVVRPDPNKGYLVDTRGNMVVDQSGDCWRHVDADRPEVRGICNQPARAAAVAAPAPAPVVVAAAPAPMAPAAPIESVREKISFSGDALFAFDKSVLKPEGMVMLDGLVKQVEGASFDTIVATGHTDRFGSDAYNQRLSERRAQTVKDYLVGKNVKSASITAEGKGETQPVTKPGDCKGAKSAKVIACLQPDRRVDIEMTGTRAMVGSR